jgi:hypothetical protein
VRCPINSLETTGDPPAGGAFKRATAPIVGDLVVPPLLVVIEVVVDA